MRVQPRKSVVSRQFERSLGNQALGMRKEPGKKKEAKMLRGTEGFYYLTERVLMSPFPSEDFIEEIADYLNKTHENHYLVYNLSEYKYDYALFQAAVMEYSFPGLPCPSLDSLFVICTSM